jgi:phosphoglycolate phosphatase
MHRWRHSVDAATRGLEAAIFDFDGTLAELVLDFAAMKRQVAALAAAHLETVPPANGLPALEYAASLARAMADADTARAYLQAVAHGVRAMEIEAAGRARLFPTTRPALATLARCGLRCGIITRNCRQAVTQVFPDADRYVEVILTRDEAPHVKPDPRHLLDALAVLGVGPQRALMVGDHPMDLVTGKAAGTLTAGVASGRVSLAELGRAGPDFLARDVGELVARLCRGEDASGGREARPHGPL